MKKILLLLLAVIAIPILLTTILLLDIGELFSHREYTKEDWKRGAIEW